MLTATEKPYQTPAIDRALERKSLLVAYEMGTGKTFIAIAVAEVLLGEGKIQTAAIVVPANLKWQWAQQIAKLTDVETMTKRAKVDGKVFDLTIPTEDHCVVIDGDKAKRAALYEKVRANPPEYLVLSYESVLSDWNMVRRLKPGMIVLDECTAIKTFTAARTKKIKRWTAEYRLGLTGTPMDNGKPEELFSIMQWVDDSVLGRFDLFDKAFIVRNKYGGVVRYKNLPTLHAKLSQAVVRATRNDPEVAKHLPTTNERNVTVRLDEETRKAYNVIGLDLLGELKSAANNPRAAFDVFAHYHGGDAANENTQQGKIMARMQALDMLLNHPDLICLSADAYAESLAAKERGDDRKNMPGSKYCYQIDRSGLLDDITETPKLDRVAEVIREIVDEDPANKIIVFSASPRMGEFIEEAIEGIGAVLYHGGMNSRAKAAAVAQFKDDPDTRVIISSHAGAYGTDLYMANYLINYDLAWSSGTQDQINGRHSRAASTFEDIHVINMLVEDTTEERKPRVLEFKRRTASAVLDNRGSDEMGRVDNDVASFSEYLASTLPPPEESVA